MTIYVYSSLNNDQNYTTYVDAPGGNPQKDSSVLIVGKANLTNTYLITQLGMATEVTAEQLAGLRHNQVFNLHEKSGYIRVSQATAAPGRVDTGAAGRNVLAPLPEQSFEEGKAPVIGKSTKKGNT